MSDTQTTTPVMPADLPADAWIPYEAFSFLLPTMSRYAWEAGGKAGRLPTGKRLTPKTPIAYRAGDIARWFEECAAEVARPAEPLLVSAEEFDALRRYTGEELKALTTGSTEVGQ